MKHLDVFHKEILMNNWSIHQRTMHESSDCLYDNLYIKSKYSFDQYSDNKKVLWMGFVYSVNSKSLVKLFCLNPSIFWVICKFVICLGCPREFYCRFMYMAPSSGPSSLNLGVLFKVILWGFYVVFWSLEWECCTLLKRLMKMHSNPLIVLWLSLICDENLQNMNFNMNLFYLTTKKASCS